MAASENLGISDEAKDSLQNHLEDLKFLDNFFKLKGYYCCTCRKLAIRHCIANCGDVFCIHCYHENYKQPCPYCKEIVETNFQDPEFERAVFEIKVHCKFEINGCDDIVELRYFLDHIYKCKFSTEKILPKLYKEDPIADALQQLNDDVNCMKQVMGSIQEENRRICNDIQEMKNALKSRMDLQAATLIKLTDEFCKKDANDQMKAEIKQLKVDKKNYEETAAALQDKNNNQIKNIDKNYKSINFLLIDNTHKNKKATELMQKEIMLLKDALKKNEEVSLALQKENKSQIKNCEENDMANKKTTELLQKEVMLLKDARKKDENESAALQQKNNCQMKNLEENHKAFKLLMNDIAHKNKIATELTQKEITLLKEALQKTKEATKELQLEHKGEILKIESQQRLHPEDLQTKLGTQFRNELTECRYLQEGDYIGRAVAILWKIAGFQEKLQNLLRKKYIRIWSEEFFIINDGLKFKPRLSRDSEGKCIHIHLEFDHNSTDKSNAHLPYLHSRKYILLDQSNALEKTDIEFIDRPHFGMNSTEKMMLPEFYFSRFFPICLLKGKSRYLKNDQILIKIILKPISFLYKNVASSDGTLLWRIDNYSKKKRDEIDGLQECLKSKPFKTSETGYLLQVELYLNGINSTKRQYLSIYLRFIMGENDANLPSTFKYKCLFSLMHQSDSQTIDAINNHTYSFESDNPWSNILGYKFILQSQAESPKYLKGDSLLIKAVVQFL